MTEDVIWRAKRTGQGRAGPGSGVQADGWQMAAIVRMNALGLCLPHYAARGGAGAAAASAAPAAAAAARIANSTG